MTNRADRLPSTDHRYGRVCPNCAGPKSSQAKACRSCYTDRLRTGDHHCPPQGSGPGNSNWRGGTSVRPRGGSKGRPQPQTHPWRKENALLFRKRAA